MWLLQRLKCRKLEEIQSENTIFIHPEGKKLIQWILVTSILVTACLTHIYAAPYLTYEPEMITNNCRNVSANESHFKGIVVLQFTLWNTFDPEAKNQTEVNCSGTYSKKARAGERSDPLQDF